MLLKLCKNTGGIHIKRAKGSYVKFQNGIGEFITGTVQYVEKIGQGCNLYINGTDGWAYCVTDNEIIGATA